MTMRQWAIMGIIYRNGRATTIEVALAVADGAAYIPLTECCLDLEYLEVVEKLLVSYLIPVTDPDRVAQRGTSVERTYFIAAGAASP